MKLMHSSRRSLVALRRFALACGAVAAHVGAAATAAGQGAALFSENWASTPDGQLPAAVALVNGRAGVATREGAKFLRVDDSQTRNFDWAVVELAVGRSLPDDFTIEFDLLAPLSTSYPVEIRTAQAGDPRGYLGANARSQRVVATCGAIRTGVYGGTSTTSVQRQSDSVANSLHRCRVAVTGARVEVGFAQVQGVVLNDVNFGRSDRLALVVPAAAGKEAYIGPVLVSGGAVSAVLARTAPTSVQPSRSAPAPVVPIAQTKQFTHDPNKLLAPMLFQPFDPAVGTLSSVQVHIQGALQGNISTQPNMQSAGGVPTPIPYSLVVEARHNLTGTGAFNFSLGSPATFLMSAMATGAGGSLPVNVPFSYTFTLTGATDLAGFVAPVTSSGNAAVPPVHLAARRADFTQTPVTTATGLMLDSVLLTTVKTGTATPLLTMGGTITVTYNYTAP